MNAKLTSRQGCSQNQETINQGNAKQNMVCANILCGFENEVFEIDWEHWKINHFHRFHGKLLNKKHKNWWIWCQCGMFFYFKNNFFHRKQNVNEIRIIYKRNQQKKSSIMKVRKVPPVNKSETQNLPHLIKGGGGINIKSLKMKKINSRFLILELLSWVHWKSSSTTLTIFETNL